MPVTTTENPPNPAGGFRVTVEIFTTEITDLLALGRTLRNKEDGGGENIDTLPDAIAEVGWLFAAAGSQQLHERSGVETYEIRPLNVEVLPV